MTIILGDALEELRKLEPASVDTVFTDPAYPSLEKHRDKGTTTRLSHSKGSSNDWFDVVSYEYIGDIFAELYRVLKPDSHCYVMGDWESTAEHYYPAAGVVGFERWPPVIWSKVSPGMGYHFRQVHEYIAFFEKGKRNLSDLSTESILGYRRVRGGYPTEKPVDLIRVFVRQSSKPRDIVLDPFCGSGATCVAAKLEGRRYLGIDKSEKAVELAQSRLCRDTMPP